MVRLKSKASEAESGEAAAKGEKPFRPKRGRPSATQVAAIEAAIISAARTMFLDIGYANTSMEAVAASVGVSKGTLYSRYPNKSDLFRAIAQDRLAAWGERTPLPTEDTDSIGELLFRHGTSLLRILLIPEVAAFDQLIIAEASRFPELFQDFYEQGHAKFISDVVTRIDAMAAKSGWPVQDARSVAETFCDALLGWYRTHRILEIPTTEAIDAYVGRLVGLLVGGRASW